MRFMTKSRVVSVGLVAWLAAGVAVAQQPIKLAEAIKMAQERGYQAQGAKATYDAARYRDKGFLNRRTGTARRTSSLDHPAGCV